MVQGDLSMQHTIQSEDFAIRLRPVRLDDAAFIVWLRGQEHVKGKVGDSASDILGQETWLMVYFERPGDYYFVIETLGGIPVGTYGIYDVRGASAESGRWITLRDVPAAIPSAIVAFEIAFDRLELDELRVKTVSTNQSVLSLNRKFGFRQTRVESAAQMIGGRPVDQVHFLLQKQDWPKVRQGLLPLARLAGAQVLEWERAQRAEPI
jgi:RimJ/RimL family protein N-acetyltransferase